MGVYKVSKKVVSMGVAVIFVLNIVACSSLNAKSDPNIGWGNPYSGVEKNVEYWQKLGSEDTKYMMIIPGAIFFIPVVVAFLVVDLGTTIVADTIFLPIDLLVDPKKKR
jgi:uncharacterized protein YceK